MPLVLLIVWFFWNGRVDLDVVVTGLAATAAVYYGACRFLDWSPKRDLFLLRKALLLVRYLLGLIVSIIQANLDVGRIILSPKAKQIQPALAVFDSPVKSRYGRILLANSITLTPGTITVGLKDGRFCVHGLDRSLLEGLETSGFVTRIKKIEEG